MSTPNSSTKESGPKTGELAPDFTLPVTPDQHLSLSDLKGGSVVLAFYPADWSPVCSDQLALYNQILPEFHRRGAQLVGICPPRHPTAERWLCGQKHSTGNNHA